MSDEPIPLTALASVCRLKPSPAPSSSKLIAEHVFAHVRGRGVKCEALRCVDYSIAPGVEADKGAGDEWPPIGARLLDADILLLSTPVWLGYPSSVTQRVLERLDAPEAVALATAAAARNAVHLARLLKSASFPAYQ